MSLASFTEKPYDGDDSVTTGPHPLAHAYQLWFIRKMAGVKTQDAYSQNLVSLGIFRTIEDFWTHYNYLGRPDRFEITCDYHLFKEGIMPMWEDAGNAQGGKWIVRLRKGLASRYWENLLLFIGEVLLCELLAILGNQFDVGDEICGAVVSLRFQEDIISVWNRTASDTDSNLKIRDTIKRVLGLPPSVIMEYKVHMDSMVDNSSFRNTDVFQ